MKTELQSNFLTTTQNVSLQSSIKLGATSTNNSSFYEQLLKIPFFDAKVPSPTAAPIESQKSSTGSSTPTKSTDQTDLNRNEKRKEDDDSTRSADGSSTSTTWPLNLVPTTRPAIAVDNKNNSDKKLDLNVDKSKPKVAADFHTTLASDAAIVSKPSAASTQPNAKQTVAPNVTTLNGGQVPTSVTSSNINRNTDSQLKAKGDGKSLPIKQSPQEASASAAAQQAIAKTNQSVAAQPIQTAPTTSELKGTANSRRDSANDNKQAELDTFSADDNAIDSAAPATNRRSEKLAELRKHGNKQSNDQSSENNNTTDTNPSNVGSPASGFAIGNGTGLNPVTPSESDLITASLVFASSSTSTSSIDTTIATTSVQPVAFATTVSDTSSVDTNAIASTSSSASVNTTGTTPRTDSSQVSFAGQWTNSNSGSSSNVGAGESARASSGTTLSPYQEVKLVQRVLRGMEQLGEGGGQVRLRLHPPELGSLQLTVRVEGGQVNAQLDVENAAARDTLLNNLSTLKDRLADQGMKIDRFDVRIDPQQSDTTTNNSLYQQPNQSGSGRQDQPSSRFAQQNSNRIQSATASTTTEPQPVATANRSRSNGSIDLTV